MARIDGTFKAEMTWEEKAKANPLYAVMSIPEFKDMSADPAEWSPETLQDFFAKGQYVYDINIKPLLYRSNIVPGPSYIVEYGSGMGRILKVLVAEGYKCAGIDISETMLENSRRLVPEARELYLLNQKRICGAPSNAADLVYSYAVIQHISTLSGVRAALSEMCRICKPGGRLRFSIQSPDRPFGDSSGTAPVAIFNGESDSTLAYRLDEDAALLIPGHSVKVVKHTNWNGVPLSIDTVRRLLDSFGVDMTGVQQDSRQDIMFWIDGRKRG